MNTQATQPVPQGPAPKGQPWWRFGMVWLVIAGPASVVVAGIVTMNLAINGADPVIQEPPARAQAADPALTPAMKARNHAATPKP